MRRKIISTHYLRRRAEAFAGELRRAQREAAAGRGIGRTVVETFGIDGHTIAVRKRGKWDARYDVIATPREKTT